jgi:NAD kinase
MKTLFEKAVIVTRKTVLEELVERFNTAPQAQFYLEHSGQTFEPIENAHRHYYEVLDRIKESIPTGIKQQIIERAYLPQFMFDQHDLVITVGIDGLVVNTAKYLTSQPIVAINPDPRTIDGILLPFDTGSFRQSIGNIAKGEFKIQHVTMAEASLNDGQKLIAFNDLFIGVNSHVSARYEIRHGKNREEHSSSGLIVSTGAGSTGWLQSVYAGATGVIKALGGGVTQPPNAGRFDWDSDKLIYAVREPFPSKITGTNLVYGVITRDKPLTLTSHMAENGLIFSDGIQKDYIGFNAGAIATIGIADRKANLIVR